MIKTTECFYFGTKKSDTTVAFKRDNDFKIRNSNLCSNNFSNNFYIWI